MYPLETDLIKLPIFAGDNVAFQGRQMEWSSNYTCGGFPESDLKGCNH